VPAALPSKSDGDQSSPGNTAHIHIKTRAGEISTDFFRFPSLVYPTSIYLVVNTALFMGCSGGDGVAPGRFVAERVNQKP